MSLLGWIIALIGFLGLIVSVAPVVTLPEGLRFAPTVWVGVCVAGLLLAMFTRRGRD